MTASTIHTALTIMLFFAVLFLVCGAWLVIVSGRLSGKAIEMENFLVEASLTRILKYIFTHNPFTGYKKDIRILLFGVLGLILILAGVATAAYFLMTVSAPEPR